MAPLAKAGRVDGGNHRKEKYDSLGDREHGDEWVCDSMDDNCARPEALRSEWPGNRNRMSCTAAEEVKECMASLLCAGDPTQSAKL